MRKLSTYLVALAFVPVWACAGARTEDDGDGSGGTGPSSGGSGQGSGGRPNHTGGSSSHTGGTHTGGSSSSGGSQNMGGEPQSTGGGTSTGGADGSGGAGSGGAPMYEGDCADKPTWDEWHDSPAAASGDTVIFACTKDQSSCEAYMIGEDYLFECTDSHVNNCRTQKPEDGSAWDVIDSCDNLGFGGMGGMGGGP